MVHWADYMAEKIIRERGDKEEYVVESGITPSGYVHIGNFREFFTAYIVGHALRDRGKRVRHIHMWDDYDRFRKVPKNVPPEWKEHLTKPVREVPDPWGCHESYADHFMSLFEEEISKLGIEADFLHASELYKSGEYAKEIRLALEKRDEIKAILDKYRERAKQPPLEDSWQPVMIYCPHCRKEAEFVSWDGEWKVSYKCPHCGAEGETDIREGNVKLRWRVDWPMRWAHFKVDFEPAGKDHLAAGSSYDTGKEIVEKVFGWKAPLTLMYEFVGIKGQKGKMSGSKGNVILLSDLYEVLEPGIIRFIYAKARPNKELRIDLGLGLLNLYDEFDRVERIYFGLEHAKNPEEEEELKRTYELSMPKLPERLVAQAPFRFLVTLVQMPHLDEDGIIRILQEQGHVPENLTDDDIERIKLRIRLAKNWVEKYAPDDVKFSLLERPPEIELRPEIREAMLEVAEWLEEHERFSVDELNNVIFDAAKKRGIPSKEWFKALYNIFIGKDRGPRLAPFLASLNREFVIKRLRLEG
ncbi:lysyl-tRNA synthetase [Thermococcus kodakarensis KOD1]|uniref:Lysine--tRNA ligase n=1 Tax=Thermococcus kodakarensis (strain ATCC BAA-918 / JCM 12380 / KOD1) TaxID=69014 RepID=SYK_THEKO|nr:lysine--tRNA ligase [Thermococcus kodakarensis]Q5JHQ3.1 RecName: Full=Lysine--tRNA ligase; AltName: Full=Lysyl-tRNA synthetase; Short=LysRS [Thermococcus kodakarensis KOD1]WCN29473.1 lysine--tRNA ligase [Thermococcus kodakarensis]WCN31756.1 lysine--tRNA ligase [Thermococcus kodakarensis]BAD86429.1 lysyl-tRNA synthetase [Thermococcus kodakarensis KOD1]